MRLHLWAAALALAAATPGVAQDRGSTAPDEFVGTLVDMTGRSRAGDNTAWFVLHVDSYSPPEEVRNLAVLLQEKGQDAVFSQLFRMPDRGWIRVGESLGYGVPVITTRTTASGRRRITVLTDRPIQIYERMRGLRSVDYPFGLITLDLGPEGPGQGQLVAAARARFVSDGTIEMENYSTEPFRIMNVRAQEKK